MALYEVTLRQRYFDQACINTWNYAAEDGLGVTHSALELLTLMGFIPEGDPLALPADTVAALILAQQNAGVEWLSVEARELYSLTDFYEAAYSPALTGGLTSGDAMSPFVAYGLFSNRVRTDIRRGFKRFVGVSEGQVSSGGVLSGGALTWMTSVADAMSETLDGVASSYFPCIVSRLKEAIPDTDPVRYRYVLYPDPAEQDEHIALNVSWASYTQVRSQTSRQYGRGQ